MILFGQTLKAAREAKGLTISQLSETTHIAHAFLEALENERFDKFAAPIYVRGFIKLYCAAVGLDAAPLIEEFMAIYNGEREPAIKERPTEETEIIRGERLAPKATTESPDERPLPKNEELHETSEDVSENAPFSRYAPPLHDDYSKLPALSTSAWRLTLLAVAALAFLCVLFIGIRALYKATSGNAGEQVINKAAITSEIEEKQTAAPAKPTAGKALKTARKQQKIPDLYID